MIVSQIKAPLLGQGHPHRIALPQNSLQRHDLLIIVNALSPVQLPQMLLVKIVQHRENTGRHRRRGVEIFILDGGVDTGICGLLYGLVDREQTAEGISGIGACFIQAHSQNLLWTVLMWILQIISLNNSRTAPCDIPFCPDAEHHGLQQGRRIGSTGKNGPGGGARHSGRGRFIPGVEIYSLPQHRPQRQYVCFRVGRTNDLQPLIVGIYIFHQPTEAVPQKETDGKPGRVG